MNLIELPEIALQQIFSYLTYNQMAENRIVCKKFNELGKEMLNRGYNLMERFHKKSLKAVKSKLPRRESERKMHPLSRQCEILIAIETRMSMLSMTFSRFIEARQCCFIPGKVIDEMFKILRVVNASVAPPRDILQELRDISSMAMEHFDEKIAPTLKRSTNRCSMIKRSVLPDEQRLPELEKLSNVNGIIKQVTLIAKNNSARAKTISILSKRIFKKVKTSDKTIRGLKTVIGEQGKQIRRLRRILQGYEAKFRDLSAEVRGLTRQSERDAFPLTGESIKEETAEESAPSSSKKRKIV